MRWRPWRARRPEPVPDAGVPLAAAPPVPADPPAHRAAGRPGWRSVPPLRPTVSLRAPSLVAPGLPQVSGVRRLSHPQGAPAPGPARATPAGRDVAPPLGRVAGLATVLGQAAPEEAEPPRPAMPHPPVPRQVRALDRRAQPPAELVHAVDAYVGEARVPAQPHRAPAWLRALSQASPQALPGLPPALAAMPIQPGPSGPPTARSPFAGPDAGPSGSPPTRSPFAAPGAGSSGAASSGDTPFGSAGAAPGGRRAGRGAGRAAGAPPGAVGGPAAGTRGGPAVPPAPAGAPPATPATAPGRAPGRSGTVRARRRTGLGPPLVPPAAAAQGAGAAGFEGGHPAIAEGPEPGAPTAGTPAAASRGDRPATDEEQADEGWPVVGTVPADLTHAVRSAYGLDAATVPVRYGARARQEARRRDARAFTAGSEIVLGTPPAGDPAGRALLAHELVHLVQQRDLGGTLPEEGSAPGAALEADAVAAEHAVLTGRALPPLRHRPLAGPAPPGAAPRTATGRVQRAPLTYPSTAPAAGAPPSGSTPGPGTPSTVGGAPPGGFAPAAPPPSAPAGGAPGAPGPGGAPPTGPGTGTATGAATTGAATGGWAGFGQLMANSATEITLAEWGIADLPGGNQPGGTGPGGRGTGVGAGPGTGTGAGPGGAGTGTGAGPRGPGGTGAGTGSGGQDQDPWRLTGDARTRWSRLGEVVGHDLGGIVASPWGIDIDDLEQPAGANGTATGTGTGTGTGGGQAGPVVRTDPSRPASPTGRPQIDTDDLDLDELAGRLYDRLRSRLRMELLLDRERAGLLTDFR